MYEKIPEELKRLDRWVCWKWEDRNGVPSKVPVNPISGGRAMSNNPATWGTFDDAVERAQKDNLPGIGFMFNGDGVVGVDIDKCRNPETGELTEEAKDIISTLDSYTEYSQSGTGIHTICYGNLPEGGRRKGPIEMYCTGRYFIMTGKTLDDAHAEIEERTDELAAVHEKYINVQKKSKSDKKNDKSTLKNSEIIYLDDDELIKKALAASNGDLFKDLYYGNWKHRYSSQSEADIALSNLLAFWTNGDHAQADRIFRSSALYRDKWDEKHSGSGLTYGQITINKAIADCKKGYEPRKRRERASYQSEPDGYAESLIRLPEPVQNKKASQTVEPKKEQDPTTDLGRSKIFSDKYKEKLCWCGDIKCWLIWNGKSWQPDKTLQVMQMAKETVEEMIREAGQAVCNATGEDQVKAAKQKYKETLKGKGERQIKAMLDLAKSDVPVTMNQFDRDPFLLNCQNGVVDLRTGNLQDHKPDYFMTKIAHANYDPSKKFELFGEFLRVITQEDAELAEYFQQICGMAAVGKVFHEGIAIFYGGGQNGKSTFLNCISKVFGDYASSINPEMLMSQRDGRQPVGITKIDGKRFVTAMELEEGRRLSGAMLKQLASTDPITGRELYQTERTFLPSHTLIMATNFLPKIGSTDTGTWRRIAVVPFKASIVSDKQIKDFANILFHTDGDAILSWIVQGAVKYIKNDFKIKMPKSVQDATKEYRAAEDWLGNFIQECCEEGAYEESGGNLYDSYREWCSKNNESYVRRSRDFASALEQQGYEKRRTMHGSVWVGLRLLESAHASSLSKYKSDKSKQQSILDDEGLDEYTRKHM